MKLRNSAVTVSHEKTGTLDDMNTVLRRIGSHDTLTVREVDAIVSTLLDHTPNVPDVHTSAWGRARAIEWAAAVDMLEDHYGFVTDNDTVLDMLDHAHEISWAVGIRRDRVIRERKQYRVGMTNPML